MPPTIKDVAREAGVSIATVSYVLNGKNSFVSQETRRQVIETAKRIGYRPNATARNLQANRTRLIGYSWHEIPKNQRMNSVLDTFTYYLAQAAESYEYHLLTFTHPHGRPLEVYDQLMLTARVDAFVLADTVRNDERIKHLIEVGFPFIGFGRSNPDWTFHWVDTDNQRGMREAVEYLLQLGHRRIAMAAWPEESITGNFRLAGYLEAMSNAGLPVLPEYIVRGEHSEQAGRDALAFWWQLPAEQQPTAVVAVSDPVAIGVMYEAESRGLVIGRDLSVIGFDDTPMAVYLRPALTTVEQPIPEVGRALMTMLEAILKNREPDPPTRLIPPRLIIRNSCGPGT
jgi:LacI family transcriptional regulator